MALLTTSPLRRIVPSIEFKERVEPVVNRPIITPVIPKRTVLKIISGYLRELKKKRIRRKTKATLIKREVLKL